MKLKQIVHLLLIIWGLGISSRFISEYLLKPPNTAIVWFTNPFDFWFDIIPLFIFSLVSFFYFLQAFYLHPPN